MTTPTTNYGLLKAQDADLAREYLKTHLAAALDEIDTQLAAAIKSGDTAVITETLLALGAVTVNRLADGAVTTAKLADDAVETAKIKDGQVTAAKMAANAIATATVQDAAITAAKLAADAGNFGASAAWTPTVTQGVAVTVTVNFATYVLIGKLVVVRAHLGITSSGTAGSAIVIGGWPTAINPRHNATYGAVGQMAWRDDSTGAVAVGIAAHPSSTTLQLWTNTATSPLGATALAANDSISFTLVYEVA